MTIVPVKSRADLKKFILFPYSFYKNDPNWIPPLLMEVRNQFNPKRNPTLDHCEYVLFLLMDGKKVIGRIAAFIDHLANDFWNDSVGLFGYYDCINNPEASVILLNAASQWLKSKGMKSMRGPWTFVSQEWGLVIEGFTPPPVVMAPYNPVYYINHLDDFGFSKAKDLLCYYISGPEGYVIPERILTLTNDVVNRYNIKVRQVDLKKYNQEVETIIELSNKSLIDNWGYAPVTDEEARAIAKDLRTIIQRKGVLFAENAEGKAIGFIIAIPDINHIIKNLRGRLLPFGWLKLWKGLPKLNNFRLFALGVLPEYQGKGVDSLLYRALHESLYSEKLWLEINYILEDNYAVKNAIIKLDAKPLRRYRVYEKKIA